MNEKKLTANPDTPQLPAEVQKTVSWALYNNDVYIETGKRKGIEADICAAIAPLWQKQMDALTFYANAENYHPTGWQDDMDPSPVNKDNGERARLVLIALKDTRL